MFLLETMRFMQFLLLLFTTGGTYIELGIKLPIPLYMQCGPQKCYTLMLQSQNTVV